MWEFLLKTFSTKSELRHKILFSPEKNIFEINFYSQEAVSDQEIPIYLTYHSSPKYYVSKHTNMCSSVTTNTN